MVFIATIYISLSKPKQQNEGSNSHSEQTSVNIGMYGFVLNYIINHVIEILRRTRIFFSSMWNVYTLTTNVVLLSGGVLTLVVHTVNDHSGAENIANNRRSINNRSHPYCLRTARWFLLHNKAGPIITCIMRVLKDVIFVFLIWMIVYLPFALGIWLLCKLFRVPRLRAMQD